MEKFGKSQPVKRVEDVRLLTGGGRYVDDLAPEGALFAFFLRSPIAHGEITELDVDEARQAPGVKLVLTLSDLEEAGMDVGLKGAAVKNRDGTKGAKPERPSLARDRVRHVGEPVAMVVAETLAEARDAAEMIGFDIEELAPHVAPIPGGPQIHPEAPDNVAYDFGLGDESAVDAALAHAANVITLAVPDNRVIAASMEPRGLYAEPEGNGRLHVCLGSQGVWEPKADLARMLRMAPEDVRVTTGDVGGGFGMKGFFYPEYAVIAQAARMLNAPVRWMSDRSEAMLSDNAGRDLTSTATLAFDADHRLLAYKVETLSNLGAYNSGFAQAIQSELFAKVMPGVYDVQTIWLNVKGIYTNTAPVDAYRGAGRPEAIYVLERMMDRAARELGVEPAALRRINFIRPEQFPYTSATGQPYDVGKFDKVLSTLEQVSAGFDARRAASEQAGKLRGRGLSYYIESILGDPIENVKVTFDADGGASIYVGTQTNGQGHETVFAQFLSDQTGIPADRIRVIQGDSDRIEWGGGTGGSRSVTIQNTATLVAVEQIVTAFGAFLADQEGVDPAQVTFDDERFRIPGSNLTPSMLEVAGLARTAGRDDLLTHAATGKLKHRSYPNGGHMAEAEIDPETGQTQVVAYWVVDDLGNLINPMLAEGQVHGGVVQGIGQAVTEQVVHDETGQLLSASFMDYAIPRAYDVPFISFTSQPVPSLYNPLGMKGCGEAGTVGALAAVANAVQDALWARGVRRADMPFTPYRVWRMLAEAEGDAAA